MFYRIFTKGLFNLFSFARNKELMVAICRKLIIVIVVKVLLMIRRKEEGKLRGDFQSSGCRRLEYVLADSFSGSNKVFQK